MVKPSPVATSAAPIALDAQFVQEQQADPRRRDQRRRSAKRRVGFWPSQAQASRLLGISSSANTVATTPEVMKCSAK